jgi:surfactin synthase thioesterase subunit/acyl carrier protein
MFMAGPTAIGGGLGIGAWRRYNCPMTVQSATVSTLPGPGSIDAAGIAAVLAAILDLDTVAPDDDFFTLGGDSTAAVALMTEIEARTGLKLEISILLEAPTPNRLAARIAGNVQPHHPLLLPVEESATGVPLFLVHGLLGQVFLARYLKGKLGPRSIWGIQAAPQDPLSAEPKKIAALAEDYIAAIRSVRPKGPYLIGGYCAGTYIAWEMAQRLTAAGESIPLLFAIDPPPVIGDYIGGRAPAPGASPLDDQRFLAKARLDIRRTGHHHKDFAWVRDDPVAQQKAAATAAALRHAYLAYRPTPYTKPVVFLCSANKARLIRGNGSPWHWLTGGTPSIEKLAHRHTDLFTRDDPTLPTSMKRAIDARGI